MLPKGLLRDSDFLKLWFGQAVSRLGSQVTLIGLPLTALRILGASPLQMGALAWASGAPVLVFGLFAGAWADRLRRRPILIAADLGRAAVLALVPLAAMLGRLTMVHLYMVAAVSGFLTVVFDVSYQAWLPSLVERENVAEGYSRLALTESVAEIAGPFLTGALVQLFTAPIAILCDAVSFAASAVSLRLIRKPEPAPVRTPQPHMGREIAEGLRATWHHPLLRPLAGRTATAAFFLGFGSSLYVLFVTRELGLTPVLLGIVISAGGISNLAGAFLASRLARRWGLGRTLIGSALTIGGAMLAVPLARGPVAVCTAVLIASQLFDAAWPVFTINETSLRQAITPLRLLGRVNAAIHLLYQGLLPLGALAGGALAQAIGVRTTILVAAVGILLSTLWLVCSPVRGVQSLPIAAEPASQ
jgi:predicted MFS family arabinose efflux permease